jgi:hypothetical protein
MTIAFWATQALPALVFACSGLITGTQSTERAGELGMTGVVNLPLAVTRLTADSEHLPHLIGHAQAPPMRHA